MSEEVMYFKLNLSKIPDCDKAVLREALKSAWKMGWLEKIEKPKARSPKKAVKPSEKQLSMFEAFWHAYGYKKGKKPAQDTFCQIPDLEEQFSAIMFGAKQEYRNRGELVRKGSTPKMAQGWLTERRWEDYEETPQNVVAFAKDEPPEGWVATLEQMYGHSDFEKDWYKITPTVRAELITEIKEYESKTTNIQDG